MWDQGKADWFRLQEDADRKVRQFMEDYSGKVPDGGNENSF
jgi:hypothetical protein